MNSTLAPLGERALSCGCAIFEHGAEFRIRFCPRHACSHGVILTADYECSAQEFAAQGKAAPQA